MIGDIMPIDSAFTGGVLCLAREASPAGAVTVDMPVQMFYNAFALICVIGAVLALKYIVRIFPEVFRCLYRVREELALDYSVHQSRTRDVVYLICILPICLLITRFRLYDPSFLLGLGEIARALSVVAIFLGYLLLRKLLHRYGKRPKTDNDIYISSEKIFSTAFVACTFTMLPAVPIMWLTGVSNADFILVLRLISGIYYLVMLVRKTQILGKSCNLLTTFLYLCALEFLPTGIFVAALI